MNPEQTASPRSSSSSSSQLITPDLSPISEMFESFVTRDAKKMINEKRYMFQREQLTKSKKFVIKTGLCPSAEFARVVVVQEISDDPEKKVAFEMEEWIFFQDDILNFVCYQMGFCAESFYRFNFISQFSTRKPKLTSIAHCFIKHDELSHTNHLIISCNGKELSLDLNDVVEIIEMDQLIRHQLDFLCEISFEKTYSAVITYARDLLRKFRVREKLLDFFTVYIEPVVTSTTTKIIFQELVFFYPEKIVRDLE